MSDLPIQLNRVNDIIWYQALIDPVQFYFLPAGPRPQLAPNGTPMASLLTLGSGGNLQLSTRWHVADDELEAVRAAIVAQHRALDPSEIKLDPAPIKIERAALWLGDGQVVDQPLQINDTVSFPPHAALFSVLTDEEQTISVLAALTGREKFLAVQYDLSLQITVQAEVHLTGDVDAEAEALRADSNLSAVELVDQALAAGQLKLVRAGSAPAEAALWTQAEVVAREQAADWLRRMAQDSGSPGLGQGDAELSTTVTLSDPIQHRLTARTDVAGWFTGRPLATVQPVLGTNPTNPPDRQPESVHVLLDWPASIESADIPVTSITVQAADHEVALQWPDFAPQSLPLETDTVQVTTHYAIGGDDYTIDLTVHEPDLTLSLADLGLTMVTIDARDLRENEARKARIDLQYLPTDQGEADRKSCHFRHDTWQAHWLIISRAATLAGRLEYEGRETTADRQIIRYDRVQTTEPVIILKSLSHLKESHHVSN